MDTNRLRQFYVLSQTENLREAAHILGISHSGLSKSLKALQEELKEELFVQKGRGIQITEYGQRLAGKLPHFFEELKDLTHDKLEENQKNLRIGTFEVFSTYFLQKLSAFYEDYQIEMHEVLPGELERSLLNFKIDLGITYEPIPTKGIEYLKVTTLESGIFSANKDFKKMSFLEIPFATPKTPLDSIPTGVKGLDGWPEDKFPRFQKFRVDMLESGLQLAQASHCAVFIPKFIAKIRNNFITKEEYQLKEIPLPKGMRPIKHSVYLVKRSSQKEDAIFKKMAKILRELN